MAEPQLSVRSAKAKELAHRLAKMERRSIAAVVERALEEYEHRHGDQTEPAAFYQFLKDCCASDVNLESLIQSNRKPHKAVEL
ncbi:MAG: type II toxin-antitoxin system VapB family antitoxin [Wenzhouxiangella sp.]|jgi:hypothetical protein|nr:type II toxin-antitoxin system VapB family antitoxin [Wenzhouxiangella sp.]